MEKGEAAEEKEGLRRDGSQIVFDFSYNVFSDICGFDACVRMALEKTRQQCYLLPESDSQRVGAMGRVRVEVEVEKPIFLDWGSMEFYRSRYHFYVRRRHSRLLRLLELW